MDDTATYCRYCPYEIMLVVDQSWKDGVIVGERETWRTVLHTGSGKQAGGGECQGPASPDGRHTGIPDLTDVEAVERWLQEPSPANATQQAQ